MLILDVEFLCGGTSEKQNGGVSEMFWSGFLESTIRLLEKYNDKNIIKDKIWFSKKDEGIWNCFM